jgi:endoglucanase
MKKILLSVLVLTVSIQIINAKSTAQMRAEQMGLGMNLSYLDNYWLGTKEKKFADFMKPQEALKRKKMFADIRKAGFTNVRIPICFSAWLDFEKPYKWNNQEGVAMADAFVKWALDNDLIAIIDLHHTEFDGSIPEAKNSERIVAMWSRIADRYKDTNPDRVLFEIRNEPHDITAEAWRKEATEIIRVVRRIAPKHTLVVGFHDWNGRTAMIESEPFEDENIIYTFHYYDPFIFTHQGATWAGDGLPELSGIPFPFSKKEKIKIPSTAEGKWVGNLISTYQTDSSEKKMFADLKATQEWSEKHKVPIFMGEFGSYTKSASEESRCRHAKVIYTALGKLDIPSAWWEWNGGFNMFKKGTSKISECMQEAMDSYRRTVAKNS